MRVTRLDKVVHQWMEVQEEDWENKTPLVLEL